MRALKLVEELNDVLSGEPWHGSSVLKLIEQVDPKIVHDKSRGPHSIADILLHMIAWTEETNSRLKGKFASDPARGDWPESSAYTWKELVEMFVSSNEHLKESIVHLDEDMLTKGVNDDRYPEMTEKISYEQLIKGIISHHIYHSGQIAILNK